MEEICDFSHVEITFVIIINSNFCFFIPQPGTRAISTIILDGRGDFEKICPSGRKFILSLCQARRYRFGAGKMTSLAQPVPEKMPPRIFACLTNILLL